MRRLTLIAIGLLALAGPAEAQYGYPSGYGGYGYGGFGGGGGGGRGGFGGGGGRGGFGGVGNATDPAAGYMAGLGAFARGQGVYRVENAQAQAINLDTMLKWNKALRARQKELRAEQAKQADQREVERRQRVAGYNLENGTTLNNLLLQILQFDPGAIQVSKAGGEITPAVIREIPFEWDTEAITICIDQLTARDSIPPILDDSRYVEARNAMRSAIDKAIREDMKGNVAPESARAVSDAIDRFHDQFAKNVEDFTPGADEASRYFSTLASLVRLLHDPSMKKILTQLEDGKTRSLGELIGFMNAFNLRFGPTTSPRQVAIYQQLLPMLSDLQAAYAANAPAAEPPSPDAGKDLQSAAKGAFSNLKRDDLKAHAGSR